MGVSVSAAASSLLASTSAHGAMLCVTIASMYLRWMPGATALRRTFHSSPSSSAKPSPKGPFSPPPTSAMVPLLLSRP